MGRISRALKEHGLPKTFWQKAVRNESTGCLEWQAASHEFGYGVFGIGLVTFKAHRLAYWFSNGPFDESMHVLHKCDNPRCIDSSHLYLGTDKDNARDRKIRGRMVPPPKLLGTANFSAKLRPDDVQEIRKLYRTGGWTHRTLGKRYRVKHSTIGQILRGKKWSWLQDI